ncbi:MAG: hypothetical protein ACRDHD_02760 [Candidatus Limnocylindria bacterium]
MVIAALVAFTALLIAWIAAPAETPAALPAATVPEPTPARLAGAA